MNLIREGEGLSLVQLLFIPGIKGSEFFEGENKRWFPRTLKDLEALKDLDNNLLASSLVGSINVFGIFTVDIYKKFLDSFSEKELFIFPYDWRQSLLVHTKSLVEKIIQISESVIKDTPKTKNELIIIAHSMGGILAKLAVLELSSKNMSNIVSKLITIGTPWQGAPDSFKALYYGEPGLFSNASQFFKAFNDVKTRDLARMFPSVYQLLPSQEYVKKDDGVFLDVSGNNKFEYRDLISRVQSFYNSANKNNDSGKTVDMWQEYMMPIQNAMNMDIPENIEHDCLIGCDVATLYKMPEENSSFRYRFKNDSTFKNGDGVVPIISAQSGHSKVNNYYVSGVEHVGLCSEDIVIDFVDWSISGKKGAIPQHISVQQPNNSELKRGFIAIIKCPVDTTILDSQGRYLAGVFDPNVPAISPLIKERKLLHCNVGDSKYIYINDDVKEDLNLKISAHDTGVADIAVQIFSEKETNKIYFEPIAVTGESLASLNLPFSTNPNESILQFENEIIGSTVKKVPANEEQILLDIPKLILKILPAGVNVKRSRARDKIVFSGLIKLIINSTNDSLISDVFYVINNEKPIRYREPVNINNLITGRNVIRSFGKDIYNRPIEVKESTVFIDNMPPITKINLIISSEGIILHFDYKNNGAKSYTNYRIFYSETNNIQVYDDEWTTTKGEEIYLQFNGLNLDPNSYAIIEYFSSNEFGLKEEIQSFKFSLGFVPDLMWSESFFRITPRSLIGSILYGNYKENHLATSLFIKSSFIETNLDEKIGDNVRGLKFETDNFCIIVLYSEKYSLYFEGPPTEVLKIGQRYNFSFQLITDRSKETISNTSPLAKLHPTRKKSLSDIDIPLNEENGTYFGSFEIIDYMKQNYKLIITDSKNIKPPLREISLLIKE